MAMWIREQQARTPSVEKFLAGRRTGLSAVRLVWTAPTRVGVGQPAEYTLTATNECDQLLQTVAVQVRLPGGVSVSGTEPATAAGGVLTWNVGTLASRGWSQLKMTLRSPTPGDLSLGASATFTGSAAECRTQVKEAATGVPGIHMAVVDSVDPVRTGDETVYVVRVTNTGTAADRNLTLVCELPGGMTLAGVTGPVSYLERVGVDFNGPGPFGNTSTVTFETVRELGPKAEAVFRLRVTAGPAGNGRFKATLTSDHLTAPVTAEESTTVSEK